MNLSCAVKLNQISEFIKFDQLIRVHSQHIGQQVFGFHMRFVAIGSLPSCLGDASLYAVPRSYPMFPGVFYLSTESLDTWCDALGDTWCDALG